MVALTGTVGDGGANAKHDVALVQLTLRLINNSKGIPYFSGSYTGQLDSATKSALASFQKDQKLTLTAPEKSGLVAPSGGTLAKLNGALPAKYADMRAIAGTNVVYMPAPASDSGASTAAISSKTELDTNFKQKILAVVNAMYSNHQIALEVVGPGWRRTFAEQAAQTKTGAGPGESNHNFGRAVDLGFRNFKWVNGDGSFVKEGGWLGSATLGPAKSEQLWSARDAIALQKQGLFLTNFQGERVHLQSFSDSTANARKSLAKLLTTVGTMKWEFNASQYNADLGLGVKLVPVGTAKQIWAGAATITAAEVADAAKGVTLQTLSTHALFAKFAAVKQAGMGKAAAPGKAATPPTAAGPAATAITAKDVTAADLKLVKEALKSEFATADSDWAKWVAVP